MAPISIKAITVACLLALAASIGTGRISSAQIIGGRIEATGCASAIGGNVSASTVSVVCGIPPEVLDALVKSRTQTLEELASSHKETIALLKQNLDLNQRQIRAALDILGEKNVPPERLASKLLEIAERFNDLQQTAIAKLGDDPKIASLKSDAQKAIGEGDLDKADKLLADVELEQGRALDRLAENKADTAAQRGDIAMTRLRYGEAAKHYADAAAVLASASAGEQKRLDYLNKEAAALYQQGDEFGDNAALHAAIDRYRGIINLQPRERVPLDWATTQDNLGNALRTVGERESGTAKLEEAAAAYRAALQERTRERVPFQWALTQTNLGAALETLGERESGTAKLEEAVAAYRAALQELTREHVPLDWARTQNNLGNALEALGERESGTARLEEAVAAHRAALQEHARERVPLDWATTQNNLGGALYKLGVSERDTAKLEEAIGAYRAALEERTRERVPLDWAATQNNLGGALATLGARESGSIKLEEAVAAFQAALRELTPERVPLDWATSTGSQGVVLMILAQRKRDAAVAEQAVIQIKAARDVFAMAGHYSASYYKERLKIAQSVARQLRSAPNVSGGKTTKAKRAY